MRIETEKDLRRFLSSFFDEHTTIYLFGSRAKKKHTDYSDYDIAIDSTLPDIDEKIVEAKWILENSNFPYKIDLINLKKANRFQEVVYKEGIIWNINNN